MPSTTFFADGYRLDYTPAADVAAGDPVEFAGRVGIADLDIAANELGALRVSGIYLGDKVTGAVAVGDLVYWDADGDPVGGTAGDGAYTVASANGDFAVGVATKAALSGDAHVEFALNVRPALASVSTGSVTVDADVLVIPVTDAAVLKTTGADAEALTLADGVPGQVLTVVLVTDGGGAGTLTPATATGFATIVFADAGDQASLLYVDDTIGWVLLGASGVAAPPAITV